VSIRAGFIDIVVSNCSKNASSLKLYDSLISADSYAAASKQM